MAGLQSDLGGWFDNCHVFVPGYGFSGHHPAVITHCTGITRVGSWSLPQPLVLRSERCFVHQLGSCGCISLGVRQ